MGQTLLKKVWDLHTVRPLPTGQTQLFIGLHLVHEVTSPQAFDTLRQRGWSVARPVPVGRLYGCGVSFGREGAILKKGGVVSRRACSTVHGK